MKTAEQLVNLTKGWEVVSVSPNATLKEAIQLMVDHNIGSVLVKEGEEIVGIWTERDLVLHALSPDFNIETSLVKKCMETDLVKAQLDEDIYRLMDKFLGKRVRHILVENKGKFVGLLSLGDVIKYNLNEKTKELESINSVVNWDYYENWHW
ncbi:MAG: hypothetical protein COB67_07285 [SAR324 cluster bacterium]|uniref:CBS domain-containing protein n=1 Tax=SAR324 cluster bacterium TaxID=2024889 RepID=A0A2A4T4Q8_9DELT|nr:MAG: hypothetical protein COB67_07285 [SAR324 cluster bacterium]